MQQEALIGVANTQGVFFVGMTMEEVLANGCLGERYNNLHAAKKIGDKITPLGNPYIVDPSTGFVKSSMIEEGDGTMSQTLHGIKENKGADLAPKKANLFKSAGGKRKLTISERETA